MAGDDRIRLSPDDRKCCVSELLLVDYKLHLSLASQTKHAPGTRQNHKQISTCKLQRMKVISNLFNDFLLHQTHTHISIDQTTNTRSARIIDYQILLDSYVIFIYFHIIIIANC